MTTANWRGAINILEGRANLQRDLDRLKKWADWNFIKVNKSKDKVLPFRSSAPAKARS